MGDAAPNVEIGSVTDPYGARVSLSVNPKHANITWLVIEDRGVDQAAGAALTLDNLRELRRYIDRLIKQAA